LKNWKEWTDLLKSDLALDRCDAAEDPPATGDAQEIAGALVPLLVDDNHLVRLAAAESLGLYPGTQAAAALREYVCHETHPLARAYGLSSLGLVGDEADIPLFLSVIGDQSPSSERVHGLLGFFELSRRIAVDRLKKYMATGSHEIRTSAAAALGQMMETPRLLEVIDAIQAQADKEEFVGVRGYFEAVLQSLSARDDQTDLD